MPNKPFSLTLQSLTKELGRKCMSRTFNKEVERLVINRGPTHNKTKEYY